MEVICRVIYLIRSRRLRKRTVSYTHLISQLFALYPAQQIRKDQTPKLALAAEKTLDRRLENGGGHTGWSKASVSYTHLFPGKEWELTAHYFATGQLKFDPGFIYKKVAMSQAQEAFQMFKTPGLVKGCLLYTSHRC